MERLTEWNKSSHKCAYYPRCFEEPCYGSGCKIKDCPFETAVCERLAAYEDTGMTPGEVRSLWGEWNAMMSVLNSIGGYDRLRELAEADKEGRVVVLPCKVGDTAWVKDRAGIPREMRLESPDIRFVCTDEDNLCMSTCGRTRDGYCAYRIRNDNLDIGKTVFLNREEAEAALKEVRNGNR